MAERPGPAAPHELQQALLAYAAAPGKFSVKLRQPAVLFASITDVLQLASMRQAADPQGSQLAAAARFFVVTALLHPESDHHGVLGADEKTPAGVVKERYRLLMRLLHPDFASGDADWPADAAARVNRAYDYVSSGGAPAAPPTLAPPPVPVERPARAAAPRRAVASDTAAWNLPKSRLKHAFFALGFVGLALMLVVLNLDRQGPVQLVQRPAPPVAREVLREAPAPDLSVGKSIGSTISDLLADFSGSSSLQLSRELTSTATVQATAAAKSRAPVTQRAVERSLAPTPPPVVDTVRPPTTVDVPVNALGSKQELSPDLPAHAAIVAAAPAAHETPRSAPPTLPARVEAATPQGPATPVSLPAQRPGLTLVDAQPLLAVLLQQMETGRGERVLSMLEPDARMRPAAQAFSKQYDGMALGVRVRLTQVQFRAEPGDGKLVVVGQMRLQSPDLPNGPIARKLTVQAEFVSRDGVVMLTGISGGPVN